MSKRTNPQYLDIVCLFSLRYIVFRDMYMLLVILFLLRGILTFNQNLFRICVCHISLTTDTVGRTAFILNKRNHTLSLNLVNTLLKCHLNANIQLNS